MNLKREALHRLLLAKSILSPAQNFMGGQSSDHLIAKQLLNSHDAADLVFAAIADHQGRLPLKGKDFIIQCLDAIDTTTEKHAGYFKQLNEARNILKHNGVLPNTQQWSRVAEDAFEKLSSLCNSTLGVNLEDVDELDLVVSEDVKARLSAAKRYRVSGEIKSALEEVSGALFEAFDRHPNLWEIRVGRGNAEDALKLTAYGVPASDFLRLQEFLPEFRKSLSEGFRISWRQGKFGHPGNWRDEVVDFCIKTCLSLALSIQNAPAMPAAIEFRHRYEYKVTAKEDQVEVWEDLIEGHLGLASSASVRPYRVHARYLNKGESITVPFTEQLVSFDLSLAGDEIQRVQVKRDTFSFLSALGGGLKGRAQFVNLAEVDIACFPLDGEILGQHLPRLPEIRWEPGPDDQG
jgi:hypothetical protein